MGPGQISRPSSLLRAAVQKKFHLENLAQKSAIYGEGSYGKCGQKSAITEKENGHFRAQKSAISGETFAGASRGLLILTRRASTIVAWTNGITCGW